MKHEIGIRKPDYVVADWPGKYEVFSWLEYVITVPNPIFVITTRKANGTANANLHSWGLLVGQREELRSLLALLRGTHSAANILREREWCVDFPSLDMLASCTATIVHNGADNDEIVDAGFTREDAKMVRAPRIAESLASLECRLEWDRPLYEGSDWHLFCGRVVHAAVDDRAMAPDPVERMRRMQLMYNIRSCVNPATGEYYGPNTYGLITTIAKAMNGQRAEEIVHLTPDE
jgi:flavin reductase (DIM6/NTAB) family NADH-FMN oxidoreductase RutF